jgi:hypothetical protein
MRTLSSELGPLAHQFSAEPRVYADANVPAGLVSFMRARLHWDVLFVLEHDNLRRARDTEHFHLARQLRRTLITLDRDYLDDRRFPLAECGGVLVVSGPDEALLANLLVRFDRSFFRASNGHGSPPVPPREQPGLPLEGRKLHVHPDWAGEQAAQ